MMPATGPVPLAHHKGQQTTGGLRLGRLLAATALATGLIAAPADAQVELSPVQVRAPKPKPAPVRAARPPRPAAPVRGAARPRSTANVARATAPSPAAESQSPNPASVGLGSNGGAGPSSAASYGPAPLGGQLPEPQTRRQVSQNVSVVDRRQIEETNPTGTLDVLREVPGVSISRSGGIGGQVYVRGFNSNDMRVPLFVDGDRFRGRNTLQFLFFPPEEIERIEVIRGPASSLYGSDPLSGLVNVITRRAMVDPTGPFHITGGGYSFGFGSAARAMSAHSFVEGAGEGFDLRLSLTGRRGDDYATPQGPARNSDYQTFGGSLKLGYSPTADQRLELTLRDEDITDGRAGGIGGAPGFPFLRVRENTNQVRMARLAYSGDFTGTLFQHIEASLYANEFYTKLSTLNTTSRTQTVLSNSYVYGPLVLGGKVLGSINWGDLPFGTGKTTIGGDIFSETRPGQFAQSSTIRFRPNGDVASIVNVPRRQSGPQTYQTDAGVFILNEWTPFPALTVSTAGRYDWINTRTDLAPLPSPALLPAFVANSDINRTAPTGSAGLVYRLLPAIDLVANIGTSYRAPTNSQLFVAGVQGAGFVVPNPDLRPEKGVTYEGGARFHVENASLTLTAFHSTYKDLILTRQIRYQGTPRPRARTSAVPRSTASRPRDAGRSRPTSICSAAQLCCARPARTCHARRCLTSRRSTDGSASSTSPRTPATPSWRRWTSRRRRPGSTPSRSSPPPATRWSTSMRALISRS